MKAAVVVAPHTLDIIDIPEPILGDYDVLCTVLVCGICNGTDNHILAGAPYHKVTFPAILGHEAIGQVISCGPKVKNIVSGDLISRVRNSQPSDSPYALLFGALAERGIATDWQAMRDDGVPQAIWQPLTIHRVLPKDFDPIVGVMLITWRETYSFVTRMDMRASEKVIIIGTGGNALSFVEHMKNMGVACLVIGSKTRQELFKQAGASIFVPYDQSDIPREVSARSFDVADAIIDTLGNSDNLNTVLPFLKHQGKIGVYGLDNFLDYAIKIGATRGDFTYFSGEMYDEGSAHDAVMKMLKNGQLHPWLYMSQDHIYPLANTTEALRASHERRVIKSVVTIGTRI